MTHVKSPVNLTGHNEEMAQASEIEAAQVLRGAAMAMANLAVHVDHDSQCQVGLDLAVALAQRCDAHLCGVYVDSVPMAPELMAMSAAPVLIDTIVREQNERADAAHKRFDDALAATGLQCSFRRGAGPRFAALSEHARYADLMIISQEQKSVSAIGGFADYVVMESGRPVLMVPYIGAPLPIGGLAVVAWDGSREAARAVSDALPLLAMAQQVQVVIIEPQDTALYAADLPGVQLCEHLARHNLKTEAKVLRGGADSAGGQLLSHVADVSANLVVMGAYGHSRLREMVLGGVTRHMLQHMTVPVLMSH
ncbi:MAG: nucleotide-binding universal stress UspA family protein [Gammaproteobacteria bacterium]